MSSPYPDRQKTFEAFARHVSPGKAVLFEQIGLDLVVGERAGVVLEDAFSGRRYFDCHCNGGVFNLGHRHPHVVAALRRALEHLDVGNHHLVSGYRAALAERLAASTAGRLPGVVFATSGGEAIDLAIKVARGSTGRRKIVSARGGYHGHTGLALAAGDPAYRDPFGPNLSGFEQVPFGDAAAVESAVDDTTAAVLLEPIPATLGIVIPPEGYLAAVARVCRERGALLMLDEVQSGLGRTGRFWAHEHEDVQPDVIVTGKGLGGGLYPIAATLMTRERHAFFDARPFVHVSTFGGAELGCAAALATLDVTETPGFLERVNETGSRLDAAFAALPCELRRRGLMMGFRFDSPDGGIAAAHAAYDAGVLCAWANNDTSVLQFLPPLVLTDAEVEELIERVQRALGRGPGT
jgi:acetylornithine/succinyldiaminopimelate/putrescine aminotransferase